MLSQSGFPLSLSVSGSLTVNISEPCLDLSRKQTSKNGTSPRFYAGAAIFGIRGSTQVTVKLKDFPRGPTLHSKQRLKHLSLLRLVFNALVCGLRNFGWCPFRYDELVNVLRPLRRIFLVGMCQICNFLMLKSRTTFKIHFYFQTSDENSSFQNKIRQ